MISYQTLLLSTTVLNDNAYKHFCTEIYLKSDTNYVAAHYNWSEIFSSVEMDYFE